MQKLLKLLYCYQSSESDSGTKPHHQGNGCQLL